MELRFKTDKTLVPAAGEQYGEIAGVEYELMMKIEKYHIGVVLAVLCVALLISSFFLPWWIIEREEWSPTDDPTVHGESSHEFGLLGISTTHRIEVLDTSQVESRETPYSDIEGSELGNHFTILTLMTVAGIVLIVASLVLRRYSGMKRTLRSAALILAFLVIFIVLGSAAYLHMNVPREVGNSRYSVGEVLGYGSEWALPNIQTFAGTDFNQTYERTLETVWGPSLAWYSAFAVCIVMIFSTLLLESKPKEES